MTFNYAIPAGEIETLCGAVLSGFCAIRPLRPLNDERKGDAEGEKRQDNKSGDVAGINEAICVIKEKVGEERGNT